MLAPEEVIFTLERRVTADGVERARVSVWSVATDASPWGGGAVMFVNNEPAEYCVCTWQTQDAAHLGVAIGDPAFQTFWELLTVALALCQWSRSFTTTALAILNDNVSALQSALDMKGKGPLVMVAREIAWRRANYGWAYEVAHLPSEQNALADDLSRLHAPDKASLPAQLSRARACDAVPVTDFWKLKE